MALKQNESSKSKYIIINASNERIWLEFERKNYTTLVFLITICPKVLKKYFMTNPFNNFFDDFVI